MPQKKQAHGAAAYVRNRCRCERCKQSWADTMRASRARKKKREAKQ